MPEEEATLTLEAKDLISKLLCSVNQRLGSNCADEIKVHPWFIGVDWDNIYNMEAAFIPEVKDEMDTHNFEKFEELVKIGDISKECEVVRVDKGSGLLKVPAVPNPTPACVNVQEAALRKFPDIVVATPGCMIDHLCNSMSVHLDELAILILDQADQLLELGFSAKISELVRAASVTCFAGMTSSVFFSLPEDKQEFIISSSINASLNDEVPSVRSAACRAIGVIACFPQIYHSTEVLEKFIHAAERNARDSLVSGRITASWAIANICDSLGHCLDALHA